MTRKKKIITAAVSTLSLVAVGVGAFFLSSTNAFFVDKTEKEASGLAGQVTIADEQILVNNASSYITGNGVDIDMGSLTNTSASIEGTKGWYAEKGSVSSLTDYKPVWTMIYHGSDSHGFLVQEGGQFVCDSCGKTYGELPSNNTLADGSKYVRYYLFPTFFRTKDGEVAYCMDNGKIEPSDGVCNMSTPVSEQALNVLKNGYPQKKGSAYGIKDYELEWCTQVALYIVEGTCYDADGTLLPGDETKMEDFGTYYTYLSENEENAEKLKNVIKQLVDSATDASTSDYFKLGVNTLTITKEADGYKVGPYKVNTNLSGTKNLVSTNENVKFMNDAGEITSLADGETDFYVYIPASVKEEVKITVSMDKTLLPSYYYWSGRISEQKMAMASSVKAQVTAHINTAGELMPGDVVDFQWTVENLGNKSVVTRNHVYLYWELDADAEQYGNAEQSIFLYQQITDAADIRKDMLSKAPKHTNLVNIGELKDFVLNGETYRGYHFMIEGDDLDGVGRSAETQVSREINYGSEFDDNFENKDVISYKLGFSQFANIHTSGQKLKIAVVTEAMQYQNTGDATWEIVGFSTATID